MHFENMSLMFNYLKTTESGGIEDGWNCADRPGFGLSFIIPLACGFGQVIWPLREPQLLLCKNETGLSLNWVIINSDEIMDGNFQHCPPLSYCDC